MHGMNIKIIHPSRFLRKKLPCAFLVYAVRATFRANLLYLDVVIIMSAENCKLRLVFYSLMLFPTHVVRTFSSLPSPQTIYVIPSGFPGKMMTYKDDDVYSPPHGITSYYCRQSSTCNMGRANWRMNHSYVRVSVVSLNPCMFMDLYVVLRVSFRGLGVLESGNK
jgi:hypothetical protein